jgi:hypothetical protein
MPGKIRSLLRLLPVLCCAPPPRDWRLRGAAADPRLALLKAGKSDSKAMEVLLYI